MSRVGRMAWKSILYFVSLTFIALMIGLIIVNIIKPGEGVSLAGATFTSNDTGHISLKDELNKIFQPSFFQAAVGFNPVTGRPGGNGGEILAIVFMSVIFSIAIMKTKIQSAKTVMLEFNHSLSQIMFSVVNIVMMFAPFGSLI
jgi:proton glutamate symport protein